MPRHLPHQPSARGGASRVPFKSAYRSPLTSGCLSARARVPRLSAPPRPLPRRLHDELRLGQRAAPLGPPSWLRRRPLPAPQQSRGSSCAMSVAGLKKQFHKATQVRRVTGAPRGGPGSGGRAGRRQRVGSVGITASSEPGPAAPRIARPDRRGGGPGIPGLGARLASRTPGSGRRCGHPRVPGVQPSRSECRPRIAQRGRDREGAPGQPRLGAQVPGRRGGRLCKVAFSLVTLRCRCARLSRDVLAGEVARPGGGCGDARGLRSSPVVSEFRLPRHP